MSKPYKFKLKEEFSFTHPALKGVFFYNEWCCIQAEKMIIRPGYAWDGCSPKKDVLGLFVVGTPDGRLNYGVPITYWASLAHDALCQFRSEIEISKEDSLRVFNDLLKESGFPLRGLYVFMTDMFGPQDFQQQEI